MHLGTLIDGRAAVLFEDRVVPTPDHVEDFLCWLLPRPQGSAIALERVPARCPGPAAAQARVRRAQLCGPRTRDRSIPAGAV